KVVFDALLDPELYAEWTPMVDLSFEDSGPPRVGWRGRFRMAQGPIKGLLDMEIVELEPERRVAIRVSHPSLDWLAVTTLQPDGQGTRVKYAGEMALRGWRRILEPMMGGEVSKGEATEIRQFKALLEHEPTGPQDPAS
ncbi:MAG: SRPBCC family protein, partial [Chloroflexi bacterium]|nr:SRPBCC family protein [Chloroflexota bacterium]